MKDKLIELRKDIEKYYREIEGLDITNMEILEDGKVRLDYVESSGGGFSSVGDFDVEFDELVEKANYKTREEIRPMHREWNYNKESLMEAIDYAWDKQIVLLLYPEDMDLIVADAWADEYCLLKHTLVLDTTAFKSKEVFQECISIQERIAKL